MSDNSDLRVAELLKSWSQGDDQALPELVTLIVDDLRAIARRVKRGEPVDLTWKTTEVIHELYLRYANSRGVEWKDIGHFFAASTTMVRRILTDHARYRGRRKREGERWALPLEPNFNPYCRGQDEALLELNDVLERLEVIHPRQAQVVQMLYFGGLTQEEAAAVLGLEARTVRRDWRIARLWLLKQLSTGEGAGNEGGEM